MEASGERDLEQALEGTVLAVSSLVGRLRGSTSPSVREQQVRWGGEGRAGVCSGRGSVQKFGVCDTVLHE